MNIFKKLLIPLAFLGLLALVVIYVEPPKSWNEASTFQILVFFLPLLFAATLLIDIFVKYFPHSFIFALGLVLLLAFYAVRQLNYLTGALAILVTVFSWRIFPKMKLPRFRLTREPKIPKLHIQKQEPPRRHRLRRIK
ncbi:MAG TPA: hypothetical protein VJG66_03845 [Patescibacteria group bacterium]|nr:hypothetical protein [Patescibacteria group bacterium]